MLKKIELPAIILIIFLIGCDGGTKREGQTNKSEGLIRLKDKNTEKALKEYFNLKNALVESDSLKAASSAQRLASYLKPIKGADSTLLAAKQIGLLKSLSKQRTEFSTLSNLFINLVQKPEILNGKLFIQYCPMANENTGAFWISGNQEIRNPYYGAAMLECGDVKREITAAQ